MVKLVGHFGYSLGITQGHTRPPGGTYLKFRASQIVHEAGQDRIGSLMSSTELLKEMDMKSSWKGCSI